MRLLASLCLLCVAPLALAENPYTSMSAPELRTRIANVDAVQNENWYQVEVLAFARQGLPTQEYWRLDQHPQFVPDNAIHPSSETPLLPENADRIDVTASSMGSWKTLPQDQLILIDMLNRMEKTGNYRLLYHNAWIQPIRERSRAFPIYITGGKQVPLIAATQPQDLDYGLPPIESDDANSPALDDSADPVMSAPAATQPELQGTIRLHLSRYLHVEPDLWYTSTSSEGVPFWVRINQNRRMRSDELHYIDHPLFGLLVRITPFKTAKQKEVELMKSALKAK